MGPLDFRNYFTRFVGKFATDIHLIETPQDVKTYAADDWGEEVRNIYRRVELCMNAGKCKIMASNNWEDSTVITAEGTNVESGRRLLLPGQLLIKNRKFVTSNA